MKQNAHRASKPRPNLTPPADTEDRAPPAGEASRTAALIAGGSFYAVAVLLVLFEYLRG